MSNVDGSVVDFETALAALKEAIPSETMELQGILDSRSKGLRALATASFQSPANVAKAQGVYHLAELCYIRVLRLYGDPSTIRKSYKLTAVLHSGAKKVLRTREVAGSAAQQRVVADVHGIVAEIIIEPTGKKPAKINSILATGYRMQDIDGFSDQISEVVELRRELEAFVSDIATEKTDLEDSVASLRSQKDAATLEVGQLTAQSDQLATERDKKDKEATAARVAIAREKKSLSEVQEAIQAAANNEAQLKATVAGLNEDIATKQSELQKLTSDRNIISDEFRDYVAEGKGQASLYGFFATISLGAVGVAILALIEGAQKVAVAPTKNLTEAYALIVQRAPFASALVLSITLLLTLTTLLVKSIFAIHGARLTLARLLVLARETVDSAAVGLTLADEVTFKERIRLKVDLLRLYMTQELGQAKATDQGSGDEAGQDV